MLKRLRWMAMGLGLGAYAQRRFKQWVRSHTAPEIAARKATEVRAAFSEGRQAMRQREAQLRNQLDAGR